MLEQHTELIERLLHGSLTRTSEFDEAWSFTNDGTLYFTVWDQNGTTFFSRSEREPSASADLQTDCDSVAAYVLTTELGAKRAMALHFDVPRFPRKIDQLHPSWAAERTPWPPTLLYHHTGDPHRGSQRPLLFEHSIPCSIHHTRDAIRPRRPPPEIQGLGQRLH